MKSKILATLILFGGISSISYAQDQGASIRLNQMEMEKESYSQRNNVSEEDAEERLKIMQNLPFIVGEINTAVGDNLSGVWFSNDNFFRLNVRLTQTRNLGALPRTLNVPVDNGAKTLALDVNYIPSSKHNRQQIEQALSDNSARIAETVPEFSGLDYDPRRDEIIISTALSKRGELRSLRRDRTLKRTGGIKTRIVGDVPIPTVTSDVFGGDTFFDLNNISFCTAGFTATRNGRRGVISAEHCIRATRDFTRVIDPVSLNHDMAFFDLNDQTMEIRPLFREDNFFRFVTELGDASDLNIGGGLLSWFLTGTQLCHFGQRTGFSCGEVLSVTSNGFCSGGSLREFGKCKNVFIVVEGANLRVMGGDSGGPVFNGGIAHGIVSAAAEPGTTPQPRFLASRIEFVSSELGANILVGP